MPNRPSERSGGSAQLSTGLLCSTAASTTGRTSQSGMPLSGVRKIFDESAPAETQAHRSNGPIPEDRPSPPPMPWNHLKHIDARDEALGQKSIADVLLTKPPMFWSEAFCFHGFCR